MLFQSVGSADQILAREKFFRQFLNLAEERNIICMCVGVKEGNLI
jgi:hypothetical protein